MRCIIAGSRNLTDYATVKTAVEACPFVGEISMVLSGGARGVDELGERWAAERGLPVERHVADWKANGKAAGPLRNHAMATTAEALIALPMGDSPGTRDMIRQAAHHGLRVHVVEVEENIQPDAARRECDEHLRPILGHLITARDRLQALGYSPDSKLFRQAQAAIESVAELETSFRLIADGWVQAGEVLNKRPEA